MASSEMPALVRNELCFRCFGSTAPVPTPAAAELCVSRKSFEAKDLMVNDPVIRRRWRPAGAGRARLTVMKNCCRWAGRRLYINACSESGAALGSTTFTGDRPAVMDVQSAEISKEVSSITGCNTIRYTDAGATMVLHPALDAAMQVLRDARQEIHLSYRFVHYDLAVTVLPGMLFALATHMKGATFFITTSTASLSAAARAPLWQSLSCTFAWMWLYVCVVTLANQALEGPDGGEDALNKPSRPIPSGQVTVKGTYYRLVWACSLFVLLGMRLRVGLLSALWVASTLTLNCWRPALTYLHWLVKPIGMMIGIFVMCMGPASLVTRSAVMLHRPSLLYMGTVSFAIGIFASNIQDFRDVEGDRRSTIKVGGGRVTLPILLGDMRARYLSSFLLMCSWATLHVTLMALSRPYNLATSIFTLCCFILLSLRTLFMRSSTQDHQTYMMLVYLYCFTFLAYLWVV